MKNYNIIGLMSGTSLDGLDIAYISFSKDDKNQWHFQVRYCETLPYPSQLRKKIQEAPLLGAEAFCLLDRELSGYFATCVNAFIKKNKIVKSEISAVSSHGQTIFHQPEKGLTVQIGNHSLAAHHAQLKWVCDFRTQDVTLGGNGAPLVPIGDALLFSNHAEAFLNLGGFSNISFKKENRWLAFDICPANLVFNNFAQHFQKSYDKDGELGRKGSLIQELLEKLNALAYYSLQGPKSLGVEWLESEFFKTTNVFSKHTKEDVLATCYAHIAQQIANTLNKANIESVLITGGGAKNGFLIEKLKEVFHNRIIIPENEIIDFKEAIIFAFLGLLRLENENNVLASVTGAEKDHCSGVIYYP